MRSKNAKIPMESPAMSLLVLVWERGMQDSWGRINNSMRSALRLAIGAGLEFEASDFSTIYSRFRAHHWVGSEPEWIYATAVCDLNRSAFEAWEASEKRKPFFGNNVTARSYGGFIHANSVTRDRERLAVGFGFKMDSRVWFCTGFSGDCIRVALYEHNYQYGKPKRLRKMTHDDMLRVCPAPKKARKVPSDSPAPSAENAARVLSPTSSQNTDSGEQGGQG